MKEVIIDCVDQQCKIITPVDENIHREIWTACSELDPSYFKQPKHLRSKFWDGHYRLYSWKTRIFRAGLIPKVIKILFNHGYMTTVKYNKNGGDPVGLNDHKEFPERYYQPECAELMKKNRHSIARIATGGGKTYISGLVTRDISMNTVFVVRSKDLLIQAYNDYKTYFPDADVQMVGGGKVKAGDITIVMIQSLLTLVESKKKKQKRKARGKAISAAADENRSEEDRKKVERARKSAQTRAKKKEDLRKNIVDKAKLVHIDECHMLGAETIFKMVSLFKNAINICGWSATPRRPDGRNIHLEAVAGPVVYEKAMKSLIQEGFLVPPIVRYVHIPPRLERGMIGNVEMTVTKDYYDNMDYEMLVNWQINNNPHRHRIIADWAEYLQSKNKSSLISLRHLTHGEQLESILPGSHFVHGQHKDRHDLLDAFKRGEFKIMPSTLCKEGFNAPIIEGIIIAVNTKDPEQIIGRGVRLNKGKTGCDIIHLVDDHKIFKKAAESCKEINNENEIVQIEI